MVSRKEFRRFERALIKAIISKIPVGDEYSTGEVIDEIRRSATDLFFDHNPQVVADEVWKEYRSSHEGMMYDGYDLIDSIKKLAYKKTSSPQASATQNQIRSSSRDLRDFRIHNQAGRLGPATMPRVSTESLSVTAASLRERMSSVALSELFNIEPASFPRGPIEDTSEQPLEDTSEQFDSTTFRMSR